MENQNTTEKSTDIVASWMFSLLPIGVAFVFYVVIILASSLENANIFIAYGAAAAFIGLETYWVTYGLRNKFVGTIIMGLAGIAITLGVLFLYLSVVS